MCAVLRRNTQLLRLNGFEISHLLHFRGKGRSLCDFLPPLICSEHSRYSKFISHAVYCLLLTCLGSQGNVPSKSTSILGVCSVRRALSGGKFADRPVLLLSHFNHQLLGIAHSLVSLGRPCSLGITPSRELGMFYSSCLKQMHEGKLKADF